MEVVRFRALGGSSPWWGLPPSLLVAEGSPRSDAKAAVTRMEAAERSRPRTAAEDPAARAERPRAAPAECRRVGQDPAPASMAGVGTATPSSKAIRIQRSSGKMEWVTSTVARCSPAVTDSVVGTTTVPTPSSAPIPQRATRASASFLVTGRLAVSPHARRVSPARRRRAASTKHRTRLAPACSSAMAPPRVPRG